MNTLPSLRIYQENVRKGLWFTDHFSFLPVKDPAGNFCERKVFFLSFLLNINYLSYFFFRFSTINIS